MVATTRSQVAESILEEGNVGSVNWGPSGNRRLSLESQPQKSSSGLFFGRNRWDECLHSNASVLTPETLPSGPRV